MDQSEHRSAFPSSRERETQMEPQNIRFESPPAYQRLHGTNATDCCYFNIKYLYVSVLFYVSIYNFSGIKRVIPEMGYFNFTLGIVYVNKRWRPSKTDLPNKK